MVPIGRPSRFYETVDRIVAPTQPSILGTIKLQGSPLQTYRKRVWEPRIRNSSAEGYCSVTVYMYMWCILPCVQIAMRTCMYCDYMYIYTTENPVFPTYLRDYGLTEDLLTVVFNQVLRGDENLEWSLTHVPKKQFYKELHSFLKKWQISHISSKTSIGRFYIAIDPSLKRKNMRADNIYQLIDKMSQQKETHAPDCQSQEQLRIMRTEYSQRFDSLSMDYHKLNKKFEASQHQLLSARKALQDVTNDKGKLERKYVAAKRKATKFEDLRYEYSLLEDANADFQDVIAELQRELSSVPNKYECLSTSSQDFCVQTKLGKRYSPAIRKLYYSMLSEEVPSAKIANIIKTVVRSMFPGIGVDKIQLPKRACANYMRRTSFKQLAMLTKLQFYPELHQITKDLE